MTIILASGSQIRARILSSAGINFDVMRPDVDEDIIKRECARAGQSLQTAASLLADTKALAVEPPRGALVIASDQIMEFEGNGFDKPKTMVEAKERLTLLQGKTHTLINAVTVARDGEILFRNLDQPVLMMRPLTEIEIDDYLMAAGTEILSSVGAYQIESLGSRLFSRIEGDYFSVLGLALFPLLAFLRSENALDF